MICTSAFDSQSDQLLEVPPSTITISDAFNGNDGPAPYTLVSVEFMTLQMPMPTLSFAPLGGTSYTLSSAIAPMVQVRYSDANNTLRAKLIPAPMQLTGTVTSPVDPAALDWWAFFETGSISGAAISGTSLTFTASATINVIGVPDTPDNFAVLEGYSCSQQTPVPATCKTVYPLESYCLLSDFIAVTARAFIPFAPIGPQPYQNPNVTSLGGTPYVLRIHPSPFDAQSIDMAFPVELRYMDANNQQQTQTSFVFVSLLSRDLAVGPNLRVIADLTISNIIVETPMTPPALLLFQAMTTGTISAFSGKRQVLTTDAVRCGAVPTLSCSIIRLPPTMEITG